MAGQLYTLGHGPSETPRNSETAALPSLPSTSWKVILSYNWYRVWLLSLFDSTSYTNRQEGYSTHIRGGSIPSNWEYTWLISDTLHKYTHKKSKYLTMSRSSYSGLTYSLRLRRQRFITLERKKERNKG